MGRPKRGLLTDEPLTLAEILHPMPTPGLRAELEEYRIEWERRHRRKVDLTKHYTSMWPWAARKYLMNYDIQRYWDGLPEFAQDYVREKMDGFAKSGELDSQHPNFIRLFLSGGMKKKGPSPGL